MLSITIASGRVARGRVSKIHELFACCSGLAASSRFGTNSCEEYASFARQDEKTAKTQATGFG